ncbi:MAG: hypothetical protein WKF43_11180 [Acidimicrobiales bacterium]
MRVSTQRLTLLLVLFCVMFAAVVVKLADAQVLNPDRAVNQGLRQRFVSKVIPAGRGSILDRDGTELALSIRDRRSSPTRRWCATRLRRRRR